MRSIQDKLIGKLFEKCLLSNDSNAYDLLMVIYKLVEERQLSYLPDDPDFVDKSNALKDALHDFGINYQQWIRKYNNN
jgi:hypothetical protein